MTVNKIWCNGRYSTLDRMNDKWDNVDCELDRYTTKKSRVCAKYEYSLIANDKLRRTVNAEVGI